MGSDTRAQQFASPIHAEAGDPLGFGDESQLVSFLDRSKRIHYRVGRDHFDFRVHLPEQVDQEGRGGEPHLQSDLEGALGSPRRRRGGGDLAQPPDHVVDLAANAPEHPHPALGQGGPKLGLLARESDELGRSLKRDQRSRLGSSVPKR